MSVEESKERRIVTDIGSEEYLALAKLLEENPTQSTLHRLLYQNNGARYGADRFSDSERRAQLEHREDGTDDMSGADDRAAVASDNILEALRLK